MKEVECLLEKRMCSIKSRRIIVCRVKMIFDPWNIRFNFISDFLLNIGFRSCMILQIKYPHLVRKKCLIKEKKIQRKTRKTNGKKNNKKKICFWWNFFQRKIEQTYKVILCRIRLKEHWLHCLKIGWTKNVLKTIHLCTNWLTKR